MNQIKVIASEGQLVTDSRDVADTIGKEHKELMRSIRQYQSILTSAELRSLDFFIPHYYSDSKGEQRPCFLLTKKGCDMVANKMTGEKGVLFTAEYVTRFEEMEKQFQQPKGLSEKDQLKAAMKFSLEHDETLNQHNERLTHLEETMRIDGTEEHRIRKSANAKIMEVIGGKSSSAYKELSRQVFSNFWRDFKNHFMIPRYGDLPKKQFEEGLRYISLWQPDTSLRMEIESANKQQVIREVI
ncbi:phage regulatory protein [Salimicrobium jeotgali]|uniref:Phage regulatory protein n=1 Tax=Salimicrobium jeotgali TaxID=1230341 RepID=K2FH35_9BACI|nr:phage regulatory protein [Salimicrobium jeotgali]AKG05554.1 phage regulatory protein [Salimicrobium jeotgali]EKE30451.1 putative antirepressor [Salimicrobium jeotgali]MBM7696594.1 Rha family phage regulatory protein [Salimicrobium jeotgali]